MQTAKQIEEILKQIDVNDLKNAILPYQDDERSAVKKVVKKHLKVYEKHQKELERTIKMNEFERQYNNFKYICGIDEVGRGPLAGPVVACAVVLNPNYNILYLDDSKKLSEKKREELYNEITQHALDIGIGIINEDEIDQMNILQATYKAMGIAINNLSRLPDLLLNDAVTIPTHYINLKKDINFQSIKQVPIIKGDAKSASIAAASIVAKVTRDRIMKEMDEFYVGYEFSSNKGYGSQSHIQAIKELGPCKIHRKSFIKNFL